MSPENLSLLWAPTTARFVPEQVGRGGLLLSERDVTSEPAPGPADRRRREPGQCWGRVLLRVFLRVPGRHGGGRCVAGSRPLDTASVRGHANAPRAGGPAGTARPGCGPPPSSPGTPRRPAAGPGPARPLCGSRDPGTGRRLHSGPAPEHGSPRSRKPQEGRLCFRTHARDSSELCPASGGARSATVRQP